MGEGVPNPIIFYTQESYGVEIALKGGIIMRMAHNVALGCFLW